MLKTFTLGMWEADYENMTVHAYKEPGYVIAKVEKVSSQEEQEGNLRLIAKASDMFYSMRNMLFEFKRGNYKNPEYIEQIIKGLELFMQDINKDFEKKYTTPDDVMLAEFAHRVRLMRTYQEQFNKEQTPDILLKKIESEALVDALSKNF